MGHETLSAITEELVFRPEPRLRADEDGPEVSVAFGPAGRETLALIEDVTPPMRATQPTLDYGDRISNAPGSSTPSRAPIAPVPIAPVPIAPIAPIAPVAPRPESVALTIFEMLTFVVQGADVASLASEAQRRRFVEAHLLQRLPAQNMAQVDRVDVTPWTVQGTLVVRIWCKI